MKPKARSAFDIDFDSYILQCEPDKKEKGKVWKTAIGLQQVDKLTPSKYLYDTARRNIDGEITIKEAKDLIDSYYESKTVRFDESKDAEEADSKPFDENSWYFRNALVRANYTNIQKGIYMNTEYLERFFRNLILGEHNELKNRYCHIRYDEMLKKAGAKVTEKVTEKQVQILKILEADTFATIAQIYEKIGISTRKTQDNINKLRDKNLLKRIGSAKGGHWEVTLRAGRTIAKSTE